MGGLKNICKLYGGMNVTDANGKTTKYVWDYEKDEAVEESKLTQERWMASEKKKWERVMKNKPDAPNLKLNE